MSPARLRAALLLLFLALALPSAVLIWHTQRQLQWQAFHHYQGRAEALAEQIDRRLRGLVAAEEARATDEYQFHVLGGGAKAGFLERSPLARYPVRADLPGLLGWFEVDADGAFSSPVSPPQAELLPAGERPAREALARELAAILQRNRLVTTRGELPARAAILEMARQRLREESTEYRPADSASVMSRAPASVEAKRPEFEAPAAQAAFDELGGAAAQQKSELGRVQDLQLKKDFAGAREDRRVQAQDKRPAPARSRRKETIAMLADETFAAEADTASAAPERPAGPRVQIFASEIDPFEAALLASGQLVLYRKVWREGQRIVQGLLIEQEGFLQGLVGQTFNASELVQMSDLVIAYRDQVLRLMPGHGREAGAAGAEALVGSLLHQQRLSAPFGELQLIFTVNRLPPVAAGRVVTWTGVLLFAVLSLGFLALWRLGLRQIRLAAQQRDFVSAVSHELKTPLTSIRMYAEMLCEGWVDEARRTQYYRYIHDEAERLSRLIANVLQLARLERSELKVQAQRQACGPLLDTVRSRLDSAAQRTGFTLVYGVEDGLADVELAVDADAFTQIMINLVDNALKFAAGAQNRTVEISARRLGVGRVEFAVRDFGPGIDAAQMKKIFRLFYRAGSELTRETVGTGIGLALVRELAAAMGGRIEVVNASPGAEFRLQLPVAAMADQ